MPIETAWLDAKGSVPGQDQLGIRATAVRMYGHLVPGITNVTDRARYFAIHPYVVDQWAQGPATDDSKAFQEFLRRTECVLALGDKVRTYDTPAESYGVVGTVCLTRFLRDHPDPRQKDFRVPLDELQDKYFGNRWGGFGQYYGGPESADLGIVGWKDGLPRITKLGQELAAAYEGVARQCDLSSLISENHPKISEIARAGEVAAFGRMSRSEINLLRDIILDVSGRYETSGILRRNSCLLLLSICEQSKTPVKSPTWAVLDAALHGRTEPGIEYVCPRPLAQHLAKWQTYAFQEFLAFSMEVILAVTVEVLQELEINKRRAPSAISDLAAAVVQQLPTSFTRNKMRNVQDEVLKGFKYPALEPSADKNAEDSLRDIANDCLKEQSEDLATALQAALKLFLRICGRLKSDIDPYSDFTASNVEIDNTRFGLREAQAFVNAYRDVSVADALSTLLTTAVNIHLRVATAKLAYNNDFTYKLMYDNGRLRKVRMVDPAFSRPRLQQVGQILADLELLRWKSGALSITKDGTETLRRFGC